MMKAKIDGSAIGSMDVKPRGCPAVSSIKLAGEMRYAGPAFGRCSRGYVLVPLRSAHCLYTFFIEQYCLRRKQGAQVPKGSLSE